MRDATGLVVGSPEWLDHQRRIERKQTSKDLRRDASWQVVGGIILIALSVFTTVALLTGDNALGFEFGPRTILKVCVLPVVGGAGLIYYGLRQRQENQP